MIALCPIVGGVNAHPYTAVFESAFILLSVIYTLIFFHDKKSKDFALYVSFDYSLHILSQHPIDWHEHIICQELIPLSELSVFRSSLIFPVIITSECKDSSDRTCHILDNLGLFHGCKCIDFIVSHTDISQDWDNMGKSVEYTNKAEEYKSRAEYWQSRESIINLSMPESLEYFEYKVEESKMYHEKLKSGEIELPHSLAMGYAKKAVNEFVKKLEIAKRLWK
jgi:hypothetical protein